LKNYFTPTSPFINLFPAPIDIDSISSYKIRFAADVNDAREVVPDSAYLQIIIDTASDTLSRELVTMKASVNVAPASTTICSLGGQTIKASWKDGCGTVVFHADVCDGADHDKLQNVAITFKQDQASYKKASCYYDGRLPVSSIDIQRNDEITNALPGGLSASTVDNGNANLLKDNPIVDLIEQ
jgi:hypothetical protein